MSPVVLVAVVVISAFALKLLLLALDEFDNPE